MVCVGESVSPGAPVGLPALKGPVVLHSLCLSRGGEVERVGSCTVPPQPPRFLGEEFWRVLLSGSKYRWGKESFHNMGGHMWLCLQFSTTVSSGLRAQSRD